MIRISYASLLLLVLVFSSGCETVKGAACGFSQDLQNATDSSKNGWGALERADAWVRQNLW